MRAKVIVKLNSQSRSQIQHLNVQTGVSGSSGSCSTSSGSSSSLPASGAGSLATASSPNGSVSSFVLIHGLPFGDSTSVAGLIGISAGGVGQSTTSSSSGGARSSCSSSSSASASVGGTLSRSTSQSQPGSCP